MIIYNEPTSFHELIDNLCILLYSLRNMISNLPDFFVKNHLLSELTKIVELKNVLDFCCLYSKISMVLDIVTQQKMDKKIIEVSEAVKETIGVMFACIQHVKNNLEEDIGLNYGDLPF